ncbi:hypothetical protein [Ponticoccus litoralis]|uniref:Uncharacterized protein n=1 Tax=Ponticoccus litoralis TaxID=422297 RepID=A0AAW9SNZ9_9RHOB
MNDGPKITAQEVNESVHRAVVHRVAQLEAMVSYLQTRLRMLEGEVGTKAEASALEDVADSVDAIEALIEENTHES